MVLALRDYCSPTAHYYFFDSLNADFVSSYKKLGTRQFRHMSEWSTRLFVRELRFDESHSVIG